MLLALLVALASAQTPQEPGKWQTIPTEHYRVHYPVDAREWAHHVAGQLEEIRDRVVTEVGYEPPKVVEVFIQDPYNSANGSVSFDGQAVIRLYATAPRPGSVIGHDRDWAELLVTHELTHQVHLSRPSRNPLLRFLARGVLGVPFIAITSPRWVSEGYATVVEGRLTGSGRPHSEARAGWLRELARSGQLPTYEGLNGGVEAYLVGSAFLEWLEERTGEGSLNDLIATMTSKKKHGFVRAFSRVFGDHPSDLYYRFTAELTAGAVAIELQRPVSDTLWHHMEANTSALTVSPDGTKLAFVVEGSVRSIQVWSTEDPEDGWATWQEKVDAATGKDPELPAAKRPEVLGPEVEATRRRLFRSPSEPKWMPDNQRLVFEAYFPTPNGARRTDLVLWDTEGRKEKRITRGASVHSPAPTPDGDLLAVKDVWGLSHIVHIDLETGVETAVTEPDVAHPVAQPSVSPTGTHAAWLRNDGGWKLVVHDLESGAEQVLETPENAWVLDPSWSADGETVYASVGYAGFQEIQSFHLPSGVSEILTQTHGGARGPVVAGDSLFFTVNHFEGRDIHRQDLGDRPEAFAVDYPFARAPILRPDPIRATPPTVRTMEVKPYRGRPRFEVLTDVHTGGAGTHIGFGGMLTDTAARWSLGFLGAGGDNTPAAGAIVFVSRKHRADVVAHAFVADEPLSPGSFVVGGALSTRFEHNWENGLLDLDAGVWGDLPITSPVRPPRGSARLDLGIHQRWAVGLYPMGFSITGRGDAGLTQTRPWGRALGRFRLWSGTKLRLDLRAAVGRTWTDNILESWNIGGITVAAVPDGWQLGTVDEIALPTGTLVGNNRYELEARLRMLSVLHVFARRHRVWGDCDGCVTGGATITGVEVVTPNLGWRQSAWFDSMEASVGVACLGELPGRGWQGACQRKSDWTGWLRVSTRM